MQRRAFVHATLAAAPLAVAPLAASAYPAPAPAEGAARRVAAPPRRAVVVRAGEGRFGENVLIGGTNAIDCKLSAADTQGALSAFSFNIVDKGGPPLHVHRDIDEWFYVEQGQFVIRVGEESMLLEAGDSTLGPRGVPHTWANVSEGSGRMIVLCQPAGLMESFFREGARFTPGAPPSMELLQRLDASHGMEAVGPPLATSPLPARGQTGGAPSADGAPAGAPSLRNVFVRAGDDRFGQRLLLGGTDALDCKVSAADTRGAFSVFWSETVAKGGPFLHVHHDQDEWFFVLEGRIVFRVGDEDITLGAGDSVLAPRGVPHTWANVGEGPGRMLFAAEPAGLIESFFREVARFTPDNRPSMEQVHRLFRSHGMETLGPPITIGG